MKFLFVLAALFVLSLARPLFCQEGPGVFPDEGTRKIARKIDLKTVKGVYISALNGTQYWDFMVTDPKVIALLIEGLKTAKTTNFSNQVDHIEVIDKSGRSLISYGFSLSYLPQLSPELIKGLKAAGVEPRAWKEMEQRAKAQQEVSERLPLFAPFVGLMALLAFFFFRRKHKRKN